MDMKKLLLFICAGLLVSATPASFDIDKLVDNWHLAAANADYEAYFGFMDDSFVFLWFTHIYSVSLSGICMDYPLYGEEEKASFCAIRCLFQRNWSRLKNTVSALAELFGGADWARRSPYARAHSARRSNPS